MSSGGGGPAEELPVQGVTSNNGSGAGAGGGAAAADSDPFPAYNPRDFEDNGGEVGADECCMCVAIKLYTRVTGLLTRNNFLPSKVVGYLPFLLLTSHMHLRIHLLLVIDTATLHMYLRVRRSNPQPAGVTNGGSQDLMDGLSATAMDAQTLYAMNALQ